MLVEAAAGTGKTTALVNRAVALLAAGKCRAREIAAVTFTHKAAAEMRARLRLRLEEEGGKPAADAAGQKRRERLVRARDELSHLFVGTIHSFCARLLRERPVEADVPFEFAEMEDLDDRLLAEQVWRETLERLRAEGDETLVKLRDAGVKLTTLRESFLTFAANADIEDWAAVDEPTLNIDEDKIKSIREYAAHIEKIKDVMPTPEDLVNEPLAEALHEFAAMAQAENFTAPDILKGLLEFKKEYKPTQKYWRGEKKGNKDLTAKTEEAKWSAFYEEVLKPIQTAVREYRYHLIIKLYKVVAAELQKRRAAAGALNFQDLLLKAAALLRDRPDVRRYFADRFKYLLVDEFQDTDPIQAEVLLLLAAENAEERDWRRCVPRPGALFVVGDPKQSIYRFRRADIVTYNQVKNIIVANGGEVVHLSANFRSTKQVIDWVNRHFEPAAEEPAAAEPSRQRFPACANDYQPEYVPLQPGRPDAGKTDADLQGIYYIEVPAERASKQEEAAAHDAAVIAAFVKEAVRAGKTVPDARLGVRPACFGDFLILTWRKDRLKTYAQALQDQGVPYVVTGSDVVNASEELAVLYHVLTAIAYPEDPIPVVAFLRGRGWGASDEELYRYAVAGGKFRFDKEPPASERHAVVVEGLYRLRKYREWLAKLPAVAAAELIMEDLGLVALAAADRGGNALAGALGKALDLQRATPGLTAAGLADNLDALVNHPPKDLWQDAVPALVAAEEKAVRVMNLHKAKGLEAPVVFLADAAASDNPITIHIDRRKQPVHGYLKITRIKGFWQKEEIAVPPKWEEIGAEATRFEEAEEIRLRYVAATRAGAMLTITKREATRDKDKNPWAPFYEDLADATTLPPPKEPVTIADEKRGVLSKEAVERAGQRIRSRVEDALTPTYVQVSEKKRALAAAETAAGAEAGDAEWGNVVHMLLEKEMTNPGAVPLEPTARFLLGSEDANRAAEAAATVERVMESEFWRRAKNARRVFAEIPYFRKTDGESPETVVGGVIDLVFQEEDGWVIVDYKTSRPVDGDYAAVARYYAPQIQAYARAWEAMTGEHVKETALVFVRADGPPTYHVVR